MAAEALGGEDVNDDRQQVFKGGADRWPVGRGVLDWCGSTTIFASPPEGRAHAQKQPSAGAAGHPAQQPATTFSDGLQGYGKNHPVATSALCLDQLAAAA